MRCNAEGGTYDSNTPGIKQFLAEETMNKLRAPATAVEVVSYDKKKKFVRVKPKP